MYDIILTDYDIIYANYNIVGWTMTSYIYHIHIVL